MRFADFDELIALAGPGFLKEARDLVRAGVPPGDAARAVLAKRIEFGLELLAGETEKAREFWFHFELLADLEWGAERDTGWRLLVFSGSGHPPGFSPRMFSPQQMEEFLAEPDWSRDDYSVPVPARLESVHEAIEWVRRGGTEAISPICPGTPGRAPPRHTAGSPCP
jgi:hypothetical protein